MNAMRGTCKHKHTIARTFILIKSFRKLSERMATVCYIKRDCYIEIFLISVPVPENVDWNASLPTGKISVFNLT
jgi:hypothetical protein